MALHTPFSFKGRVLRICAACAMAIGGGTVAFGRAPDSKPVPVELWRGGDDGLTVKLSDAVEHALRANGKFLLSSGKKPGTLLVTIPHSVGWERVGGRVHVTYAVTFSAPDNRKLGSKSGACWEDALSDCVEDIVHAADAAAQWLQIRSFELPRDGGYLSTAYIGSLEKTKSHKKAWETGAPQSITVSRDKRGLVLQLNWNWHEGDEAVFDSTNPIVAIGSDGSKDDDLGKAFFPVDASHFRFQDGKDRLTYKYVGDELAYITDKILAGTYVDERGKKYVFGKDGKANFLGRTFHYEIYTDMVFEDCDEIWDHDASKPNVPKIYGFAWRGIALYLYNANCPDEAPGCTVDRKHPIAVLHKVA